ARDQSLRQVPTMIQEALEENLGSEDSKEWNWQALAGQVNKRYGLKTTDRQLKQVGKEALPEFLIEQAEKTVAEVKLGDGSVFLEEDWGRRSLCDWARAKFGLKVDPALLAGKSNADIAAYLDEQVLAMYRQKEIEFPVKVGMTRFMAEKSVGPHAGHRYDRE